MKKEKIVVDINSHIQNISCDISVESGNTVATVGFDNLGYGIITAIKFNAIGYNSFGDVVLVNGKEQFILIVQDINIEKNTSVKDLKVSIPNTDIRNLKLIEEQICFADGSVVTYHGEVLREYELEEYEYIDGEEEKIKALKDKFSSKYKFKPVENADGWICGCGRFNKTDNMCCSYCDCIKDELFNYTNEDEIINLVKEYNQEVALREEARKVEEENKKKEAKKKKIGIVIGAIIGVIILIIMIYATIMAGRTTYSSESEMKTAVAGTYTHYDGYSPEYQLFIYGDKVVRRWVNLGSSFDLDLTVYSWNPSKGTIDISTGTIVVTNTGDLVYDGCTYEKGGAEYSTSNNSLVAESGWSVLKIQNLEVRDEGNYTICTGSVKNTGTKTYTFVEVKGSFKDANGNVLDTDWTYAAGSEVLAPNESSTFRLSVPKDWDIESCSVSLLDFE